MLRNRGFVLAEASVVSPWKSFIFIMRGYAYGIKACQQVFSLVLKTQSVLRRKRSSWAWGWWLTTLHSIMVVSFQYRLHSPSCWMMSALKQCHRYAIKLTPGVRAHSIARLQSALLQQLLQSASPRKQYFTMKWPFIGLYFLILKEGGFTINIQGTQVSTFRV